MSLKGTSNCRRTPGKKVKRTAEFHKALGARSADLMNLPDAQDFRCIVFSVQGLPAAFESQKKQIDWLASGNSFDSARESGKNQILLRFRERPSEDLDMVSVSDVVFDTATNMPIKWTSGWLSKNSIGQVDEGKIWEKKFRWRDFGGIMVPSFYEYEAESAMFDVTPMHQDWGGVVSTIDFHWFSLNEKLPASSFDDKCLDELDAFMKLVDPEKAGATDLIVK